MLYINAYEVEQVYGGPEEGGWYYSHGIPIVSIPIATKRQLGKEYFFQSGELVIEDCRYCEGTGEVANGNDDEDNPFPTDFGTDPRYVRCDNCGEIPSDKIKTENLIAEFKALLEQEHIFDRRSELRITLENNVGQAFPDRRPHYE